MASKSEKFRSPKSCLDGGIHVDAKGEQTCSANLADTEGEKTCGANLADTERTERQAFKRQQFSAAKSEMAYHNHFVLNSLGGNPKSAMPVPFPRAINVLVAACCEAAGYRSQGATERVNSFPAGPWRAEAR
jgi:hypothetical protein